MKISKPIKPIQVVHHCCPSHIMTTIAHECGITGLPIPENECRRKLQRRRYELHFASNGENIASLAGGWLKRSIERKADFVRRKQ